MSDMNKRVETPGPKESLQVVNKPIPQPPPHGIVVKNHYSGICHTDVHIWLDGLKITDDLILQIKDICPALTYPIVLGHEIAGEVHALGSEYKGELAVGDMVVVHPWCACQECGPCKAGDHSMCLTAIQHNVGVGKEGGFQHYTPIEQGQHVIKLPSSIPAPIASIMSCSGITSFKAVSTIMASVQRAARNYGEAKVLIIGAGGLGLWGIQWAKALLPPTTKVFVADITEEKIKGGMAHGADAGILWDIKASDDELLMLTKEKTGGGIDGSVDFVGLASTSGKAVSVANKGATCATVGLAGGIMHLPVTPMVLNDVRTEGCFVGDLQQMKDQLQVFQEKGVKSPPITLVKPEDTERCLRELKAGSYQGRYVIDWTKE